MAVFLDGSMMPAPASWAESVRSNGFDMQMDREFDPRSFSGFLPCKYGGKEAGFEWETTSTLKLDSVVCQRVGRRDSLISRVTHSDMRELMTSVIATAVLCAITDGVLWDTESNEFIEAKAALGWARRSEAEIKAHLDAPSLPKEDSRPAAAPRNPWWKFWAR